MLPLAFPPTLRPRSRRRWRRRQSKVDGCRGSGAWLEAALRVVRRVGALVEAAALRRFWLPELLLPRRRPSGWIRGAVGVDSCCSERAARLGFALPARALESFVLSSMVAEAAAATMCGDAASSALSLLRRCVLRRRRKAGGSPVPGLCRRRPRSSDLCEVSPVTVSALGCWSFGPKPGDFPSARDGRRTRCEAAMAAARHRLALAFVAVWLSKDLLVISCFVGVPCITGWPY